MKEENKMTVKQISVFLENKPGKLAEFVELLRENGIDMRALFACGGSGFRRRPRHRQRPRKGTAGAHRGG